MAAIDPADLTTALGGTPGNLTPKRKSDSISSTTNNDTGFKNTNDNLRSILNRLRPLGCKEIPHNGNELYCFQNCFQNSRHFDESQSKK